MLKELLKNRRSTRKFKDIAVEEEKIQNIIKGALTSPSGRNLKPAEMIVVEDRETLIKLSKSRGRVSKLIENAGLAIAIIGDTSKSTTWMSDTAIMAIIIQLLGEEEGLKSCWVHVENREADDGSSTEENVRNILNVPKNYRIHCIIALGYPDEEKRAYTDEDLDFTKVHREGFNGDNN